MVDVFWKSFVTVSSIALLLMVRYSDKVFDRSSRVAGKNTEFADLADEDGNYLPGAKALLYLWIPFFLIAMWADFPNTVFYVACGVFIIAFRVYLAFIAPRRKS